MTDAPVCSCNLDGRYTEGDIPPEVGVPVSYLPRLRQGCEVHKASPTWEIRQGDALDRLREMPSESVHCVVTSPPYWGQRDYSAPGQLGLEATPEEYVAKLVEVFREVRRVLRKDGTCFINLGDSYFGGARSSGSVGKGHADYLDHDSSSHDLCDGCEAALSRHTARNDSLPALSLGDGSPGSSRVHKQSPLSRPASLDSEPQRPTLQSSGAILDQGLGTVLVGEPRQSAPESTMLESLPSRRAECLHCANCGACLDVIASASRDSQLCARKAWYKGDSVAPASVRRNSSRDASGSAYPYSTTAALKPKDLLGMPWRVAFALQADGWWLRSDIIWSKPNVMPESVTDRPTKAHEYLFLLAKSQRYFYDAEAIREALAASSVERYKTGWNGNEDRGFPNGPQNHFSKYMGSDAAQTATGRNKRTVWEIATEPFGENHFATYPTTLVDPCIKAGTSERGVCPECGAPWVREVEHQLGGEAKLQTTIRPAAAIRGVSPSSALRTNGRTTYESHTVGWHPSCKHAAEAVPAVVVDPFAGSGTTGVVALRLGRSFIGIELSPEYVEMARKRMIGDAPLLNAPAEVS